MHEDEAKRSALRLSVRPAPHSNNSSSCAKGATINQQAEKIISTSSQIIGKQESRNISSRRASNPQFLLPMNRKRNDISEIPFPALQ